MRYLSVCSGIEAATVAWEPLGFEAAAYSEIDKFPSQVLAHHYPNVPNAGDFTKIEGNEYGSIDALVGGTPCQSFSIAGLRQGLTDARGNLALEFIKLAYRCHPEFVLWENVPGVLSSSKGDDFRCFLAGLSGVDLSIPQKGWGNTGVIAGMEGHYSLAWRVLDAQYFGVPQRRRRLFLVGHFGDWRRALSVLLEPEGLLGNPAPSRETREDTTGVIETGTTGSDRSDVNWPADVASTLDAHYGDKQGLDNQHIRGGGQSLRSCVLGTSTGDRAHCLNAGGMGRQDYESETMIVSEIPSTYPITPCHIVNGNSTPETAKETAFPLRSNDGSGNRQVVAVGFQSSQSGVRLVDAHATLDSNNGSRRHNGVITFSNVASALVSNGDAHSGFRDEHGIVAINSRRTPAIGLDEEQNAVVNGMGCLNAREKGGGFEGSVMTPEMAVRRLTPKECERLQGFPDGYTSIPNGAKETADGPRYKALGNSMAVPVMRWIGDRLNRYALPKENRCK